MGEIARNERGHYLPGSGGRPHGAKNKARMELQKFVERNLRDLQGEYDSLEPKDKLRFLHGVLSFVVPKLQSTTDTEGNDLKSFPEIEWSKLSENTIREILEHTSLNPSNNED